MPPNSDPTCGIWTIFSYLLDSSLSPHKKAGRSLAETTGLLNYRITESPGYRSPNHLAAFFSPQAFTKSMHCLMSGTLSSHLFSYSTEMLPSKP
jgi:hypothetical protein